MNALRLQGGIHGLVRVVRLNMHIAYFVIAYFVVKSEIFNTQRDGIVLLRVWPRIVLTLRWRHNGRDSVSNHQPHGYLLNRLFRRRSKKTSKLRVTGLCAGNSPGTGEFPAQMVSNVGSVSIWWRHYENSVTLMLLEGSTQKGKHRDWETQGVLRGGRRGLGNIGSGEYRVGEHGDRET